MSIFKTKSSAQTKIAPNLKKQNLVETICSYGVTILSLIFFGYIAIFSVLYTSTIDTANFAGEVILYNSDDIAVNLFFVGTFFALVFGLRRYADVFKRVNDKILMGALALYTVTLGFIWIFMAQSIPAADSGTLYETACNIINGDWTTFTTSNNDFYNNVSYFQIYPFQLGFVFISEIVYRIFGCDTAMPMQVFNVLALAAMYVGLLLIGKRIFKSKAVTFIMTFMLAGFVQAIFFTSFTYGNIIGFSSAIWACYFVIRFMQSENKKKYLLLIPVALLMAFAVLAKYNNMIWLLAISIGLIIYVIRSKKWLYLLSVVFICTISIGTFNLVIASYESRSGVELGDGVSQLLYFDAGINESSMAPGWYNDMSKSMYLNANCDTEVANDTAKADIEARQEVFSNDLSYTYDFFSKKVLSQWNEPSYESLWVSQVKGHYNGEVTEDTLLYSVYNGKWNDIFQDYFDYFQMISLLLFGAGMIGLIRKKCSAETITILTALLGGFLYHLLFEGKSQYVLTYFILVVFFASYGLYFILKPRSFAKKESTTGKKTIGESILNIAEKIDSKTR
jgi:hypothetical protein